MKFDDGADRLPVVALLLEERGHREADRGQRDREPGDSAERLTADRECGAAVSSTHPRSSPPARASRAARALRWGPRCLVSGGSATVGEVLLGEAYRVGCMGQRLIDAVAAAAADASAVVQELRGRLGSPARAAAFARSCAGAAPPPTATALASHSGASVSLLSARVKLGREADQVAELADRLEVALRGQPLEAERVEVVAGQQQQVGVGAVEQPRLAVVEQVALADRLEEQRRRSRAPRRRGGRRRPAAPSARSASSLSLTWGAITSSRRSSAASCSRARSSRAPRRRTRPRPASVCVDRRVVVGERREPGLELRRAAGRRRARASRGRSGRRPRCRTPRRPAKSRGASAAKKTVTSPGTVATLTGCSPAASRSPSASRSVVAPRRS